MGYRGVHFALTKEQETRVLATESDEATMVVLQEIEEAWDHDHLIETDKAWDAIHRCFCDGQLLYQGGEYPLNLLICGGEQLIVEGEMDYTISYLSADEVKAVAEAVQHVTQDDLRTRYQKIDPDDYAFELGEDDFEYTWSNFCDLVSFFAKAAQEHQAVIFTVDC